MKMLVPILAAGMLVFSATPTAVDQSAPVTIEVMNPRSDLEPPPVIAPSPRVKELAGKRVGIYWLGKAGGDNFFDAFEKMLKEKHPTVTAVRYRGALDIGDMMAAQVVKEVDALVYGVGD